MAEAVGLVSGLLTMISFALKASQSLYDVVSSLRSQRQTIKDILTDLDALVTVLTKIKERAQQPAEAAKLEPIRRPLECCTTTCNEMREMVDACRTHSDDGQASVRDWLKMRYREKSFDDMKKRLSSYKTTLVVAFQSINIQDHSVTQESLLDLKGLISETKEDLEDQQDELRQIFSAADASLRKALEEDQARLQSSLDSIAQAQEIADTTQLKVVVRDICHDEGSRAIAGTDSSQQGLNLIVENIRVGVGATSSAGMYSPETLQRLLQHSSAPEVALVLQALQTQPPSGRNEALHSALNVMTAKRSQEALYTPAPGLLTEVEASDFPSLNQSATPTQSVRAGPSRDKSRQELAEI